MSDLINWKITLNAFLGFFTGIYGYAVLYILCLIYIAVTEIFFPTSKTDIKGSIKKDIFLYPVIAAALTVFNPVLISLLSKVINLEPRIRRIYWVLPVTLLISYIFLDLCIRINKKIINIVISIILSIIVVFAGTSVFSSIKITDNIYKIDSEIIDIADIVTNDCADENPVIIYSDLNLLQIREYDPAIKCALGRYELWGWMPTIDSSTDSFVNEVIENGTNPMIIALHERFGFEIDEEIYLNALNSENVEYIICNKNESNNYSYYENLGLVCIGETKLHKIYKLKEC